MPGISYLDFSGGLDRRLSRNSQDANKLWELRNAYVTLAKRLKKRPGLRLLSGGLTGSYGLKAVNGILYVYVDQIGFSPPVVTGLDLQRSVLTRPAASPLSRVFYSDLFRGFTYVVAGYEDGTIKHHYLDSKTTQYFNVVAITNAAPAVVTWTAHGLAANQPIRFEALLGTLPTGLVEGTLYYVLAPTADTFTVSLTAGGAAVNTTTAGSGTFYAYIPTYIADSNCPHTNGITKAASRVFAPSDENVRYCAAGNARDWTTASDAGFLPAGLEQDTKGRVYACGTFQDALTVLFEDSAQIWNVAVDPSANAISKRLYGIGTKQPLSLASFFSDLVFLSPYGARSMTVQALSNRIDDNDVGVPVDTLVQPDIATTEALTDGLPVRGYWITEFGQYWQVFDMGTYSKAWVYTFSRSSKIACWSEYEFDVRIQDMTTLAGKVYLRDEDSLYEVSATQYTDNGALIDVEVQMAFQDNKLPGVDKQFWGADMVSSGALDLSFLYDPSDTDKETIAMEIPGDTRAGNILPVEVVSPAIAPVFRHSADEAMSIDALTIFYFGLAVG